MQMLRTHKGLTNMDLNNKAELKRVWVEALRSGKYKQTQGTLHNLNTGGFCCLGVAAAVWGLATPEKMGTSAPWHEGPTEVYELLDWTVGKVPYEGRDGVEEFKRHPALVEGIEMNDAGKPFTEIADMIERDWNV
jgi:hypothetical protein